MQVESSTPITKNFNFLIGELVITIYIALDSFRSFAFSSLNFNCKITIAIYKPLYFLKTFISLPLITVLMACSSKNKEHENIIDANRQLEKDLEMYEQVWSSYVSGDTSVMSEQYFTKDVIVVTAEGDLGGIASCRDYYANYLSGFSEIEWNIVDAFGQGDKRVKHWNFKDKHTGTFFGIESTGNYLDLSGTSIVTVVGGKIAKEHDFFNMKSKLHQLTKSVVDLTIDEYQLVN